MTKPAPAIPSLQMPAPISILILTKNEERDLPAALDSVSWSDDIHVFDSGSTDDTLTIAARAGATVHHRPFDDYATHRNAALTTIPFRPPLGLFLLDADERPTRRLSRDAAACNLAALSGDRPASASAAEDSLFGAWPKHAQISPLPTSVSSVARERQPPPHAAAI